MASAKEIIITLPGKKRVDARIGDTVIKTDQPVEAEGEGSAPQPFELFLASIGTCAGIYVASFLESRGLSTVGVEIRERPSFHPETRVLSGLELEIVLPAHIPAKYHAAIVRSADQCAVKKAIQAQPHFEVHVASAVEAKAHS